MAADVTLDSEPLKSCCAEWKEKYLKLEGKRNALRQAVKLLENEVNKLQTQNLELKRVCEQEKKRADCESKEKEQEFHTRNELEKEMHALKEEIASLRNKGCPEDQDDCRDDILLSRVLEGEAKISRLNELFEKERKGFAAERKKAETEKVKAAEARKLVEVERKKAETEKVKAAEARKLVEVEKKKVEEEKKRADIERKRAQECQLCLGSLKLEANELKSKFLSEKTKVEEAKRKADAEKQKSVREKKRAESEKERILEQKKCTEAEKQKAINEKSRADHLTQQLEEERKKNEALKKEIEEVISAGGNKKRNHSLPSGKIGALVFNEKVFKDKLKMEKEKTKHAKRMAKLEKVQNSLLLKELYLLKQSALQLSHRFDVLDKCFSHGIEGTDGLAKIGNSPKVQRNKSSLRVPVVQEHDLHFQINNELTRTCCTRDALDHQGSSVECTRTLFPNFGGGHAQPTSGISSELESVIGGSVRNESQNSALYSTSTSFSDRQLIGSQGRRVLPTTASANPGEENLRQGPSVRTFSCEGTEKRYCKNLAVSGEKNVWSRLDKPLTTSSLGQTLTDGYEVQDKPSGHRKKKRRIQNASEAVAFDSRKREKIHDAMESVTSFNSNDEKLVLGMKGTSLLDVLGPESDLHGPFCPQRGGNSGYLPLDEKLSKSRRADLKQPSVLQPCGSGKLDLRDHLQFECRGDFMFRSPNQGSAAGHACRDKIISSRRDTLCFDEMASGDYTRLVQLDDPKDEERFRMAMKMPLSPTLPEIESPKGGDFEANNTDCLFENCIQRESMIEEDKSVMMACSNRLGFSEEIEVSMLGHGASAPDEDNSGVTGSLEIFEERGAILPVELGQGSICQGLASDSRSKVSLQMPIPKIQRLEVSCISMPKYFVMFSNVQDELKILRIFSAAKNCISQCSALSQASSAVSVILHELALKNDLLSDEKVSAFFSLLLHIFTITVNSGRLKSGNYAFFSDFLKEQMNKEVKSLLLELCWCDLLFSLMEDFLIAGRVWVHNDVDGKTLVPVDSEKEMSFSYDRSLFMSKTATCDQLEAGGIILASVCLVFDCVDFICDASYSILRMCNGGSAWILTVLHGFASICGEEYLHHSKYDLVMTSIKSVVLFLERGIGAVGSESSCCRYPASDIQLPEFSPCGRCPFMEGALGLDKVMLLLMDKLEDRGIVVGGHQDVKELISSVPMVPAQPEEPGRVIQYRNNINVGSEHLLQNDTEAASEQDDGGTESFLRQLTDAISLMELLSRYLSCDWFYSNVICRLLTLLDSQMHKEFSAAVLLLIGQLGRHIIDSGRCLQELEELRCNLYEFLDVAAERERGFPFQLAAVHALADLAAFDFEEFIQKNSLISVDATRSSGHAAAARKWFSQLSKEQQDLASKYFQSDKARTEGGV